MEKRAFPQVAFDQVNVGCAQDGQHDARKTGARADIQPTRGVDRYMLQNLGQVQEMATPKVGQGRSTDEIDPILPLGQQRRVDLEPVECFT